MVFDGCLFFGKECILVLFKGVCMVFDEGVCRIWYSVGECLVIEVIEKGNM